MQFLTAFSEQSVLVRLLLVLAIVVVLGQILTPIVRRLSQPPVIAQMLAGILLGPSLMGGEVSSIIFSPDIAAQVQMVAALGVIFFMFCVGLELNADFVRERIKSTLVIAHGGIVVPFALGLLLAPWLFGYAGAGVAPITFALFVSASLSVTAFPVLVQILDDFKLLGSDLGRLAVASAACADFTAWCMLAMIVSTTGVLAGNGFRVVLSAFAYLMIMLWLVRPQLRRIAAKWDGANTRAPLIAMMFAGLLVSAAITETIGIHAIFGAFLFGALVPHDSQLAQALDQRLRTVVSLLLLPAFFAYTGMRTRIDLIEGASEWGICAGIIVIASAGKIFGTWLAARFSGLDNRGSLTLGALMNTRGLMELIVLNIGLDLGILSPSIYSMLVLMALTTTMLTTPLLRLLRPDGSVKTRTNASRLLD